MTLYELIGTVEVGLIFGLVALGAFLSFRVLDFPDLTVEGSFPLGAAVVAILIVSLGWNPWPATAAAALAGFAAGIATAYLNVRYNILHILCGILVSIALYSVNLRIMGGPNKPLLGVPTVFSAFDGAGMPTDAINLVVLGVFAAFAKIGLDLFLATGIGIAMRAAGANPAMAAANGIDVGRMKLFGIGLANALTAVAGALFAQLFGAADVYMGIGVIIIGLASVIVGMSILPARSVSQATRHRGTRRIDPRLAGAPREEEGLATKGGAMIRLDDIDVTFNPGTPLERHALRSLTLDVPQGQFVTLVGSNGSGKSTVLNVIAGMVQPDRGTIAVGDTDVTRWPVHARARLISRVFQDPKTGTCENLTILENFALARGRTTPRGLRFAIDRTLREETVERLKPLKLDLENRLDDKVGLLSGGQRQAVSLLMATTGHTRVLLLDEHTSALDPKIGEFVVELTAAIVVALSLTVIMVTHSMAQALRHGDRTLMLHRGEIVFDASGTERRAMKVADLLNLFKRDLGENAAADALLFG